LLVNRSPLHVRWGWRHVNRLRDDIYRTWIVVGIAIRVPVRISIIVGIGTIGRHTDSNPDTHSPGLGQRIRKPDGSQSDPDHQSSFQHG
jgi:hypothetical protein